MVERLYYCQYQVANSISPDLDVRKKALEIAMEMVSSKNVEEVVLLLKKELTKTVDQEYEKVPPNHSSTSNATVAHGSAEQRIPPDVDPFHTFLRNQVFRGCCQRGWSFDGFHRRFQQYIRS